MHLSRWNGCGDGPTIVARCRERIWTLGALILQPQSCDARDAATGRIERPRAGDAERQIHLRRGQSLRLVGPADVVHGCLRAMDSDFGDIVRPERAPRRNRSDSVERGVIAADAGIEFERDAESFEALAEARSQLGQIETIVRAREGAAEAPIGALEHVYDPGKSRFCQ